MARFITNHEAKRLTAYEIITQDSATQNEARQWLSDAMHMSVNHLRNGEVVGFIRCFYEGGTEAFILATEQLRPEG